MISKNSSAEALEVQELNDDVLIERAIAGDSEAFGDLYCKYSPVLRHFLYRLIGNFHDTEDIIQETFVEVLRKIGTFKGNSSFRTWLHAIARHKAIDKKRRRKNHSHLSIDRGGVADDGESFSCAEVLIGQDQEPSIGVLQDECATKVHGAVRMLPELQRKTVTRFHFEDLTYDQIAVTDDVALGTVQSRLKRGRDAMYDLLREYVNS